MRRTAGSGGCCPGFARRGRAMAMSKPPNGMLDQTDAAPPLSVAGQARRDAILPLLERAMVGRIRRRRAVRTEAGAGLVFLVGLVLMRAWPVTTAAPGSAPAIEAVA